MLRVQWAKYANGNWPSLATVNLEKVTAVGVYVIWNGADPVRVGRVGQCDIKDRLCCHRIDKDVLAHAENGLWVTWAAVPAAQRDGVERFLAASYTPLVGDRWPGCCGDPGEPSGSGVIAS